MLGPEGPDAALPPAVPAAAMRVVVQYQQEVGDMGEGKERGRGQYQVL
jgi:hypothetical protein